MRKKKYFKKGKSGSLLCKRKINGIHINSCYVPSSATTVQYEEVLDSVGLDARNHIHKIIADLHGWTFESAGVLRILRRIDEKFEAVIKNRSPTEGAMVVGSTRAFKEERFMAAIEGDHHPNRTALEKVSGLCQDNITKQGLYNATPELLMKP